MSRQSDTLTVALTGQLTFVLVVSALLALIASYLILRLYRRAVIKSMRRRSRSEILEPKGFLPPEPEHKPNDAALTFTFVTRDAAQTNPGAARLYRSANRRCLLVAGVHTIAGCCFAAAMTTAFLSAGKWLLFLSDLCLSPGQMSGRPLSRLILSRDFLAAPS
jgi:phosphate/sulfate permease